MKNNVILLCVLVTFSPLPACDKPRDDFEKNGSLKGRLSFYNPYAQSTIQPVAGASVKLAYDPYDTLNFLYDVTTDKEGYFSFTNLNPKKRYNLFYEDSIDHIKYAAFAIRQPDNDTINLLATPELKSQNELVIHAKDNSGNVLPNVQLCVFNNRMLSTQADTCLGSYMQLSTNASGGIIKFNVPAGTYYFRSRLQAGNMLFKGFDSIAVPAKGVVDFTVTLSPVVPNQNGFELLLADNNNTPVNNAGICVFTNRTLFLADTCLGQIFQLKTDFYGKASSYNLAPGRYYFRAELLAGSTRLKGSDSVDLAANGIHSKIIRMQ